MIGTMEEASLKDVSLKNSRSRVCGPNEPRPELSRRLLLLSGLQALAAPLLASCSDKPQATFNSVDISGADYARTFELPDTTGTVRTLGDFAGRVVAVFFGFTQCPDVCPVTLAKLTEVRAQLGADGKRLAVVLITVDPGRDTPEVMQAYMGNFDASFLALVPSENQLAQVAKEFRIHYRKNAGSTPSSYTMEHTAATFIFDTLGRIRLYVPYDARASAVATDVHKLLSERS
jgi:protein SCO1/2